MGSHVDMNGIELTNILIWCMSEEKRNSPPIYGDLNGKMLMNQWIFSGVPYCQTNAYGSVLICSNVSYLYSVAWFCWILLPTVDISATNPTVWNVRKIPTAHCSWLNPSLLLGEVTIPQLLQSTFLFNRELLCQIP
jgi:hypothetical protein